MKIKRVVFTPGKSSFFFDDQKAIKSGVGQDGFVYNSPPVTEGFSAIRVAGESVSIGLILDDDSVAFGDATAVQYSGAGGRDPLFLASRYVPFMEEYLRPKLEGMTLGSWREMTEVFDAMTVNGERLHTAIRYGLSQALLEARAMACRKMKVEVAAEEWGLPLHIERVPLFGQSGDDRYVGVDKMILKGVEVLPHGLINNIDKKLGVQGEKLRDYIAWTAQRIRTLRRESGYTPTLHMDVYGTIGIIFNHDLTRVADYIAGLSDATGEFPLYIEGPVDMGEKPSQIEALAQITRRLKALGSPVKIVADEWCNTYEDIVEFVNARSCHQVQIKTPDLGSLHNVMNSVLYCREHDVEAYQGGTCNETDLSAKACVHVALACRPRHMLVKPGMGFDEGFTIVNNEMERVLTVLRESRRCVQ